MRASSDYGYRRLVQSGASVEALAQPEVASAPAPKVKPRARRGADLLMAPLGQHKPKPKPSAPVVVAEPQPVPELVPSAPAAEEVPEVVPEAPAEVAPSMHGTPQGYRKGCRDHCPGGPDGRTCREAISDYQRERKAVRAAQGAPAPAAPPVVEEQPPAEPVEAAPALEHEEPPADADEIPVTLTPPQAGLDFHAIANALEAFSFAFHQLSTALGRDSRDQVTEGEHHV
ncbi:hypothetical protein EDF18_0950 [Frigoribacterium sp. PhB107]|nr:hypothetical protein EDF18_0950 [Frigoribacterium sp. PhB107]